MTWFRVDDQFHSHPKVTGLSASALALWVLAGSWSACHRTGGYVPSTTLASLLGGAGSDAAGELVRRGLWARAVGGWQFHDWAVYNATSLEALARDEQKEVTKRLHRRPELLAAVRDRDGSQCQRCKAEVSWSDKRSQAGGTYALLDRAAPLELGNVVVACRGCSRQSCGQPGDNTGDTVVDSPAAAPAGSPARGTSSIRRGASRGQVGTSPGTSTAAPDTPPDRASAPDPRSSTPLRPSAAIQAGLNSDSDQTCPPGSLSLSTSRGSSFPGTGPETARERVLHAADPPSPDPAELDERYAVHAPTWSSPTSEAESAR